MEIQTNINGEYYITKCQWQLSIYIYTGDTHFRDGNRIFSSIECGKLIFRMSYVFCAWDTESQKANKKRSADDSNFNEMNANVASMEI